jgi:hypothetical protein
VLPAARQIFTPSLVGFDRPAEHYRLAVAIQWAARQSQERLLRLADASKTLAVNPRGFACTNKINGLSRATANQKGRKSTVRQPALRH